MARRRYDFKARSPGRPGRNAWRGSKENFIFIPFLARLRCWPEQVSSLWQAVKWRNMTQTPRSL